jgi:hypothetical protein
MLSRAPTPLCAPAQLQEELLWAAAELHHSRVTKIFQDIELLLKQASCMVCNKGVAWAATRRTKTRLGPQVGCMHANALGPHARRTRLCARDLQGRRRINPRHPHAPPHARVQLCHPATDDPLLAEELLPQISMLQAAYQLTSVLMLSCVIVSAQLGPS